MTQQRERDLVNEWTKLLVKRFGRSPHKVGFDPFIRYTEENADVIRATYTLLHFFDDMKYLAMRPVLHGRFPLEASFGIDPSELHNLNSPSVVREVLSELQQGSDFFDVESTREIISRQLREIQDLRLIGSADTSRSFVAEAVREISRKSFKDQGDFEVAGAMLDKARRLLVRHSKRLEKQSICGEKRSKIATTIASIDVSAARLRLSHLAWHVREVDERDLGHIVDVYADEIAQVIGPIARESFCCLKYVAGIGIEAAYAWRGAKFIRSGDYYGECTAYEVRRQVDARIANIHWTTYSWMLDPYYKIVEVFFDGRAVVKGHILPLLIHDRKVLMLDAIEVIPQLRPSIGRRPNASFNPRIFAMREKFLDKLYETVLAIARSMKVDAVYVDKFSNAEWVRECVDRLPHDSYHVVEDVWKPFGLSAVKQVVDDFFGKQPSDVMFEVQATNTRLMEQYMRSGCREVGVLLGRRDNYRLTVRGV